jgi:methionine sulfoxide reductase heme-binding subunit
MLPTRPACRLLFVACLVPFFYLVVRFAVGAPAGNPVRTAILFTGDWTMRLLILSLAVRPLSDIARLKTLLAFRRPLGLGALFYAALHFAAYLGLEYFFRIPVLLEDARRTPNIIVGFGSLLVLVLLGVTSARGLMRRLGRKRWGSIHKLVYPVAVGGVAHYALKAKTSSPELLAYAALIAVLLVYRLMRKTLGLSDLAPASPRT